MRTLLLDSHAQALLDLQTLLAKYDGRLEIVAKYTQPREALKAVDQLRPELIFADAELAGTELLRQLNGHAGAVRLIFTSSGPYEAYRAFEAGALHYLVRPYQPAAVAEAVRRALEYYELQRQRQLEVLLQLNAKRIALPLPRGHLHIQPISEIVYCMADANCCEVYRQGQAKLRVTRLLKEVEATLNEALLFCRVHHKYLINLRHVTDFADHDGGHVTLSNGQQLPVSRSQKKRLLEMLGSL
jgi:two-component system LytT family response regulator